MQTELSPQTIDALARAIARAQLTAADEYISEGLNGWPEAHRGEYDQKSFQKNQAERLEVFRSIKERAENAAAAAKRQAAENAAALVASREVAESELMKISERSAAQNKITIAQHRARCLSARERGESEPARPLLLPTELDDVRREQSALAVNAEF